MCSEARFVLFVLLVALSSCRKKNYDSVSLLGHAGAGLTTTTSLYPSNSGEAIHYAVNIDGINGCEVDCQLSADGTIWLYHDISLDESTTGSGCINEKSDEYLETVRFKSIGKEKLVKLKDLDFPYGTKHLLLDVRHANSCENEVIPFSSYLNGIQEALAGKDVSLVSAVSLDVGYVNGFVAAGIPVYYEFDDFSQFQQVPPGIAGICMRNEYISNDQADEVRETGLGLIIFEIRAPKTVRQALKKFPNFLLVDDLNTALIEKY